MKIEDRRKEIMKRYDYFDEQILKKRLGVTNDFKHRIEYAYTIDELEDLSIGLESEILKIEGMKNG